MGSSWSWNPSVFERFSVIHAVSFFIMQFALQFIVQYVQQQKLLLPNPEWKRGGVNCDWSDIWGSHSDVAEDYDPLYETVFRWVLADIQKDHDAFIFKGQAVQDTTLKMWGTTRLTIKCHIPEDLRLLSRRMQLLWCSKYHSAIAVISHDPLYDLAALQGHGKWWACYEGGINKCIRNLNKARSFRQNPENLWAGIAQSV